MRRFPAWDARRNYVVWGDLPGLGPAVHLIAATALYAEGFFCADQKAKGPRPKFEIAETALHRAISLAKDPCWADDPDWQRISTDPLFAPLLDLVTS